MSRPSKVKLAAARISGLAMACVQVRRIDEDQALAEIADVVADLPRERRQDALDDAASVYVRPGPTDVFHAAAAALLERAGADLRRAGELKDGRGRSWRP